MCVYTITIELCGTQYTGFYKMKENFFAFFAFYMCVCVCVEERTPALQKELLGKRTFSVFVKDVSDDREIPLIPGFSQALCLTWCLLLWAAFKA